jgi:phosphoglycerol transferase MdoB-like AlkP superfamily enzyme
MACFAIAKLYFLVINMSQWTDLLAFPSIWVHGVLLDVAMVGYTLPVLLLFSLLAHFWPKFSASASRIYGWVIFLFFAVIWAVDPYFFLYWGQKTNLGFTQFLGKENAGLSSIEGAHYLIVVCFFGAAIYTFKRWGVKLLVVTTPGNWVLTPLLIALSVLMMRGSIDKVPINISSAFYSSNNLNNNTALNGAWRFLATETERDKHAALVLLEPDEDLKALLADTVVADYSSLISIADRPNVILIVLESFSAKVVGSLGDSRYAATPNLDKIMREGIAFTNAYAASFRSDKGLLAITTGIPSGARQTLTNFPSDLARKPNIFQLFGTDYATGFYYGGNLEFANIKILFKDANFVMTERDFKQTQTTAWGVHDEVVFNRFAQDFISENKPQFKMLFSLSSHEPFDVPNYTKKSDPYLNSISYTDSCLGVLISQLKTSPKWANTLIILTADHGTIRPNSAPIYDTSNFRIPIVLTGGLVKKRAVINEVVSQSSIAATLGFVMSKSGLFAQHSLLQPINRAFYSYHNGVTYVAPDGVQYYDIPQGRYLFPPLAPPLEKAYYQAANADFFRVKIKE